MERDKKGGKGFLLRLVNKAFNFWDKYLSIIKLIFKTKRFKSSPNLSIKKGRWIDGYVLAWFIIEISLLISSVYFESKVIIGIVCFLIGYRLIDIIQANVNGLLFYSEKWTRSPQRTLILAMINYAEIILCFAVIYLIHNDMILQTNINPSISMEKNLIDAFYFSCMTQMTVGYGDLSPDKTMKIVTSIQALLGLGFAIVIFSRIIAMVSNVKREKVDKIQIDRGWQRPWRHRG